MAARESLRRWRGAALLRSEGRSVRMQAPLQNQFSERGRVRWRAGFRGGTDYRGKGNENRGRQIQRRFDDVRLRLVRQLRAIGRHDIQRLAAAMRQLRAGCLFRRRLWVFLTASRVATLRCFVQYASQRAVIRERDPAEKSQNPDQNPGEMLAANCFHGRGKSAPPGILFNQSFTSRCGTHRER